MSTSFLLCCFFNPVQKVYITNGKQCKQCKNTLVPFYFDITISMSFWKLWLTLLLSLSQIIFLKHSEPLIFTFEINKVNVVLHGTFPRFKVCHIELELCCLKKSNKTARNVTFQRICQIWDNPHTINLEPCSLY